MDKEYFDALAKKRLERADELIQEAKKLIADGSYKSANNRAFYAIEKCVKALLAVKELDVATHNGAMKQFNYLYIYKGDGYFTPEDYQVISRADQIRNSSDYDDFYIADKADTIQLVNNAEIFYQKILTYLSK